MTKSTGNRYSQIPFRMNLTLNRTRTTYPYCGNAHAKITKVIPMEPAKANKTNLKL